jgi:hypothetical protein
VYAAGVLWLNLGLPTRIERRVRFRILSLCFAVGVGFSTTSFFAPGRVWLSRRDHPVRVGHFTSLKAFLGVFEATKAFLGGNLGRLGCTLGVYAGGCFVEWRMSNAVV